MALVAAMVAARTFPPHPSHDPSPNSDFLASMEKRIPRKSFNPDLRVTISGRLDGFQSYRHPSREIETFRETERKITEIDGRERESD